MELININNLSVSIHGKEILLDINLAVEKGEVISLSGDNGSGKSTLLKIIFGDTSGISLKGEILYKGESLLNNNFAIQEYRKNIGYLPQDDSFCEDTPFKEACYSFKLHSRTDNKEYIASLFEKFKLSYLKDRKLFTKTGPQLSGGEKKMVSLISVLCRKNADLFLIDEPLNNLDSKNVRTISNMINSIHETNPDAGIIIVTHCHAIPCVTKQYRIANKHIELIEEDYKCFNCFGPIDEKGYYSV